MNYTAFFHAGRRHQVNWAGPGYYMAVDNGCSVAVWPANWRYLARNEATFFYADTSGAMAALFLERGQTFAQRLVATANCLMLPASASHEAEHISAPVARVTQQMQAMQIAVPVAAR